MGGKRKIWKGRILPDEITIVLDSIRPIEGWIVTFLHWYKESICFSSLPVIRVVFFSQFASRSRVNPFVWFVSKVINVMIFVYRFTFEKTIGRVILRKFDRIGIAFIYMATRNLTVFNYVFFSIFFFVCFFRCTTFWRFKCMPEKVLYIFIKTFNAYLYKKFFFII